MRGCALSALAGLGVMLLVGSCGGGQQYVRADWREQEALRMPPAEMWQYAEKAAENEIDYETLIGPGATADNQVATADGETPVTFTNTDQTGDVIADPNAAADTAPAKAPPAETKVASNAELPPDALPPVKPGSMVINAIAVPRVKGSPGDGNAELTDAMRQTLRAAGVPVIDKPRKDALTISGAVKLGPSQGETQRVGVAWTVFSPDGAILGAVRQSNDIPAGSLDKGWGGSAIDAAEAAATGIFDLIQKFR
jgi:hypothetical protein